MSFVGIRQELRPMLWLATPVVIAELGWIALTVVDTAMVGRLGAAPIGGVSLGRSVLMITGVFGLGVLYGLDTLVSQDFGAGKLDACHRWLVQGVHLAWMLGLPSMITVWAFVPLVDLVGIDPEVAAQARAYLWAVGASALPFLVYTALRRYLQALDQVAVVMWGLLTANLINIAANYVLVFGKFGLPRLEAAGAGWATVFSFVYLTLFMAWAVRRDARRRRDSWDGVSRAWDPARMRRLWNLGVPVGIQITLEVGVFALATWMAGFLAPVSLASHQVVITLASTTFMVPMGVSAAAAVRVGQATGRNDPAGAADAGWTALLIGTGFMTAAAAAFISLPDLWLGLFTEDPEVLRIGAQLLLVAGLFQIGDGIQAVATGALRGLGDTRTPMIWNGVSHWFVGLPISAALTFGAGLDVVGIWIGLSVSLTLVGIGLLREWSRKVGRLSRRAMA